MTKRMLIDASHAEETRVVLLDGSRIEDYDIESAGRQQLKGNIYLARIVRVEPSLQAAFVEYGGGRHGFLAFGEIHPDYYQIPVADRQRLIEMQEAEAEEEAAAEDRAALQGEGAGGPALDGTAQAAMSMGVSEEAVHGEEERAEEASGPVLDGTAQAAMSMGVSEEALEGEAPGSDEAPEASEPVGFGEAEPVTEEPPPELSEESPPELSEESPPEAVGGDPEEPRDRRATPRFLRNYKIQEVVRRRQIMLVQVVKEERGNKGAALTTYISLAGRYSVLMPNSPRGGGISRKITSAADRRRLKEVTAELGLPRGMGLIVRTAGANRPKPEIIRDCEYLLNTWDQIRETTMRSVAPALIYEEASLIKRAMRDLYSREVEEVQVDGEAGWRAARDFMRMLMPDAARKVQLWRDAQPLFAKNGIEAQLDAMLAPNVQLRSGGYIVINQTEALVAVDVNSGRSTRERGIEETALRTNLEAAEEVARQLRLRDLAGLVVIDFIDMESRRNNIMVERRLKEALRHDRARIQLGSISHFGLLEMSRQRLRPSLAETNFVPCPACGGLGHVRSAESSAVYALRAIEDEGAKRRSAEILVHVAPDVALYVLNHKRARLTEIEARFAMEVSFQADAALVGAQVRIERLRGQTSPEAPVVVSAEALAEIEEDEEVAAAEVAAEPAPAEEAEPAAGAGGEDGQPRRKRRRRGRGRGQADGEGDEAGDEPRGDEAGAEAAAEAPETGVAEAADVAEGGEPPVAGESLEEAAARKRRGRRGGRRRRREGGEAVAAPGEAEAAPKPVEPPRPAYTGPTPANPFGNNAFDIFDVMDQAEEQRALAPLRPVPEPPGAAVVPDAAGASPELPAQYATAEADAPEDIAIPEPPAAEPESAPVPAPVLVGAGEAPAAPKRGWWRR